MSKSHHLTEQFQLPWKFIGAISLNLQGKVTKQAITSDQAHKQSMLHCSSICYSKIQRVDTAGQTTHLFLGSKSRQDPANSEWSCDSDLAGVNSTGTLSLNTSDLLYKRLQHCGHTFSFGNVMKFTYPRSNYIIHMYSQNIKWHI